MRGYALLMSGEANLRSHEARVRALLEKRRQPDYSILADAIITPTWHGPDGPEAFEELATRLDVLNAHLP